MPTYYGNLDGAKESLRTDQFLEQGSDLVPVVASPTPTSVVLGESQNGTALARQPEEEEDIDT